MGKNPFKNIHSIQDLNAFYQELLSSYHGQMDDYAKRLTAFQESFLKSSMEHYQAMNNHMMKAVEHYMNHLIDRTTFLSEKLDLGNDDDKTKDADIPAPAEVKEAPPPQEVHAVLEVTPKVVAKKIGRPKKVETDIKKPVAKRAVGRPRKVS